MSSSQSTWRAIRAMRLHTGSWANLARHRAQLQEWQVLPVAISNGLPRFWAESTLLPWVRALQPHGLGRLMKDPAKFDEAYESRLHQLDPDLVLGRLLDISEANPGMALVMACFEADPKDCHRGTVAQWLYDTRELVVSEWLPPTGLQLDLGFAA